MHLTPGIPTPTNEGNELVNRVTDRRSTTSLCRSGRVNVRETCSRPTPEPAAPDQYEGTPRHVWQSLFLLVSTIRPEWPLNEISNEVFRFRKAMPFPELSAAAIRAAQNPNLMTTAELQLAMLGAGTDWLEGVNK